MTAASTFLLADIGGTNARFALMKDGAISDFRSLPVADFPGIGAAMEAYLQAMPDRPAIRQALLAVAGPVAGNRCTLTNSPWVVEGAHIERDFGIRRVEVYNDLEAVAWAISGLGPKDYVALGGGLAASQAPQVIIAPGTGLGVAAWLGAGMALSSEGGHASFAPENEAEDRLLQALREAHGHVSAERLISGPGLVAIYRILASASGEPPSFTTAAEISTAGLAGSCSISVRTLEHFCAVLGSVAGNLALAFGARGGVYIAGGIVPRLLPVLSQSAFRQRFSAKGRLSEWLTHIPTRVIQRPDVTLLGLRERFQQESMV
jgi:glucokinase